MFNPFSILTRGDSSEEFAKSHPVGFLKLCDDAVRYPMLCSSPGFVTPNRVDERPRCTKTEDQGKKPWCAAYAATQFAENILWRRNGYPEDIDPSIIYSHAKTVDGDPNGDGTSIPAVLSGLTRYGYFDGSRCHTRIIGKNETDVKFALHRFGVFLGGFNVTREWYQCNRRKTAICSKYILPGLGGHCVLVCGYDGDGVYVLNSWGADWGEYGFALVTWKCFQEQFVYGGVLDNCLDDMKL